MNIQIPYISKAIQRWEDKKPKGEFSKSLIVRFLRHGSNAETWEWLDYTTHDGKYIYVPAKTSTDFASVPRFFWWLFPPTGTYARAAVIHDYLYAFPYAQELTSNNDSEPLFVTLSRKQVDNIFLEAMHTNGTRLLTRYTIYYAVRAFGFMFYKPKSSLECEGLKTPKSVAIKSLAKDFDRG